MPTRREYLVSKGLAQPTRGRFNRAALAELERARGNGMVFDDDKEAGSEESEPAPPSIPQKSAKPKRSKKLRRITRVVGYTSEGWKVASDICFRCRAHVSRCACKNGIEPSPLVARWDTESEPYGRPLDALLPA
jgi:hypothetical protein